MSAYVIGAAVALGIGAASFASGTGNVIRERGFGIGERSFLSEGKFKRAKI